MSTYNYVCQTDCKALAPEVCLIKEALGTYRRDRGNSYITDLPLSELYKAPKSSIAVGDLDFVAAQLSKSNKIMYPIEVPAVLRTKEFLGREYKVGTFEEIPKEGAWFVKDVSRLKGFVGVLHTEGINTVDIDTESKESHKWVYSSLLSFVAEYRFYVYCDTVMTYALYTHAPCCYGAFPDIAKVNKMIGEYCSVARPKAYAMDVGVTSDNQTYLIEIQPFVSMGIYNTAMYSDDLAGMVDKGYEWYLSKDNKLIV